jgi:HD-like signal output (HDOD) protein
VLGLQRIRDLALAWSALAALPAEAPGFDYESHWRQALQRAVFAQFLAAHICAGREGEAFTGALLQDMATPLLMSRWGHEYLPIVQAAEKTGESLSDLEQERLGWNHAQAGAWVARSWGFPDSLVCCIGLHHTSLEEVEELEFAGTPLQAVAASAQIPASTSELPGLLGLGDEHWDEICSKTDDACGEVAEMLGVPPPDAIADMS